MSMRVRWLEGDGTPDPDQPSEAVLASIRYPALTSATALALASDGTGGAYAMWFSGTTTYGQNEQYLRLNRVTAPHVLAAPDLPRTGALALASPYPNPARGDLTLRFTLASYAPARLELLDVAGRVVRTRVVEGAAGVLASARFENLSDLAGGLYFVRITQGAAFDVARVALIH